MNTIETDFGIKEVLDALCFIYPRHNILSLRKTVGDRVFLMLLDKYGGLYVRFPTAQNSASIANEVRLALLYQHVKEAHKVSLEAWNVAEARFIKFASRMGYTYDKAKRKSKEMLRTMEKSKAWLGKLDQFDANRKREP